MSLTVVEKLVGAIADAEGVDPAELEIVLQNWVDTDALRQLVDHNRETWELQFEVREHDVSVRGDETILVDGVERRSSL